MLHIKGGVDLRDREAFLSVIFLFFIEIGWDFDMLGAMDAILIIEVPGSANPREPPKTPKKLPKNHYFGYFRYVPGL